jgi:hypothetical protein
MPNVLGMERSAIFSECRRYRYALSRTWDAALPIVLFVALNPSTADELVDDATVRRCVGFGQEWGFGSVVIANLFAYRSTDPTILRDVTDPVGPKNDWWLKKLSKRSTLTIAAWGIYGSLMSRDSDVLPKLNNAHHLGRTRGGQPKHPLYLPKTTLPIPF